MIGSTSRGARETVAVIQKRIGASDELIENIRNNKPTGMTHRVKKLMNQKEFVHEWPDDSEIFNFDWGFIACQHLPREVLWFFHVDDKTGKTRRELNDKILWIFENYGYEDRFNDYFAKQMGSRVQLGAASVFCSDVVGTSACIVFGASLENNGYADMLRNWLSDSFLKNDWPEVLSKSFDKNYVCTEWY